jgi:hypothetical protein
MVLFDFIFLNYFISLYLFLINHLIIIFISAFHYFISSFIILFMPINLSNLIKSVKISFQLNYQLIIYFQLDLTFNYFTFNHIQLFITNFFQFLLILVQLL